MDDVYKHVSRWDTDGVIRWMSGLHKCLEVHIPQFLAHCICGSDLLKMSHQQLDYLKVTQVGHQELLLEAVELLSALERSLTHDFTLSLASNLSKKTSQLINALNPPRKRYQSKEGFESNGILSRVEITSGVMMAAKLLLSWLDRNPSRFVEDYESFRADILMSALDLASILQDNYDVTQMLETCRVILKHTAVMMCPQNFSSMEPIQIVAVELQPREDSGLGFSIQRTRQGNLVVNHVIPGSPASKSGKIAIGIEIIQINDQNVVGWEISKVIETLKASGHEVTLVINTGHSKKDSEEGEQVIEDNYTDNSGAYQGQSQDESCDSLFSSNQIPEEPLTNISRSTNSDDRSSSQGTLDDIAESPASFEGDTDFSGMENILLKNTISLDIHRTCSTPLTSREKAVALEGSVESGSSSVGHSECDGQASYGERMETRSLDALDGSESGESGSYTPNQMRTSSDGTVEKPVKGKTPKRQIPPVAYRTQVIGGVVVRVPIKEDQEKSNHKRHRGSRHKNRGRRTVGSGGGSGSMEDMQEISGSRESGRGTELSTDGEENSDKGKAVFSECKEVTIGGQTTRQVTVSSSTEIVGGKKSSNPALMVPCFQLKNAQKEGFLYKLGGSGFTPKNWRRRWFVLKDKKLYYYKTAFDITALGIVDMVGYTIEQSPESKKKFAFKAIRHGARTYYFQAEATDEMMSWMESMKPAAEPDDQHDLTDVSGTIDASDDEL